MANPNDDKTESEKVAAQRAADLKATQDAFDKANPAPRLPNPITKSADRKVNSAEDKAVRDAAKRPQTKEDVIRLWAGGEHQRAMDLYHTLKLSSADQEEVKAACPTWDELATQYGGPVPAGQDGPTPPPQTKK